MLNFFVYILLTIFVVWAIQRLKIFDYIFNWGFFEIIKLSNFMRDLRSCRLCIGYWVSLGFYFLFGQTTFTDIKVVDAILVALLVDFLAYYIGEGIIRNHAIVRI